MEIREVKIYGIYERGIHISKGSWKRTIANVPYELTISIPPRVKVMERILDFLKFLKDNKYPTLEIETHETIDGQTVITYYEDGNVLSELDSEGAFTEEAPTNTLKLAGTRKEKKIS